MSIACIDFETGDQSHVSMGAVNVPSFRMENWSYPPTAWLRQP